MAAAIAAVTPEKEEELVRVQVLAESKISKLPERYIQPPSTRPTPSSTSRSPSSIPVVDLCDPQSDWQIDQACLQWGAFRIINHGVSVDDIKNIALGFFRDTPLEVKMRYKCPDVGFASEGYGSLMVANSEVVSDWRDYFDHHTLPMSRRKVENWPEFPSNYRKIMAEYSENMKKLAQRLLSIISKNLGLKSSYIEEVIGDVHQNIVFNYYPPCPQPDLVLGLQAHSDMGAVSLLVENDVCGLEFLKDGEWVLAHPLPDAITVILADQTEILSNGRYKSAIHRALVNAKLSRLSIATFYDPPKSTTIAPAFELINSPNSHPQYRGVTYGDFVSNWYGDGPDGKRTLDALRIFSK
ncbi:2-oxoglutarate (2OG) and Fe(II)-dependent oxygenase superfamilyprotein [Zostera marina]|uniref:2-oxoglutarate (2OG) and Fe(II)-dependent oxygenase superfamilyprotein n=1 Tax=Zostera marina TaxID=29655 RepID=A0A0K9PYJ3_ZOSMR|nr:2-oxoglutarate (2OG) and Fe(II)-dependent oxygenase superfamilyprotein [Zostera marina]